MNLNNKKFRTFENKEGLSSDETVFHYSQKGNTITARYSGGKIQIGFIVGKQITDNEIELLYQCLTTEGNLLAGKSKGRVSINKNQKLEIHFDWKWLNGDQSGGKSHYIEM
ncbi:MAG: hypothetical protein AAF599_08080 [Bacteroidota bacterium]